MKDRLFIDTSKNQRCRVLCKVEDIATYLVEYVKFWDDWEVDRYGNANLVIIEFFGGILAKARIWSLNEDILKIIILKTNTPYPSRKIWRIRACTHQRPQRNKAQYAVSRRSQYAVLKITMTTTAAQQVSLDNALVPPEK
ncbi:hypothetical protein Tco_0356696 [Tanacetum coccineum]